MGSNHQNAFDLLKSKLGIMHQSCAFMCVPILRKLWFIKTDASDIAMAACVGRIHDTGHERPVAYGSATLTHTKRAVNH